MWHWIEEFARAVESSAVGLDLVSAREEAAAKVRAVLEEAEGIQTPTVEQEEAIYRLLDACRVFMRDRRGIDTILTVESLYSFLVLADTPSWSSRVHEEALKCVINSVYSRPDFVSETLLPKGFLTRLMEFATHGGTTSLHWLVWKVLLVACEAPEVSRHLSSSLETWQLIYATLFYGFKHGEQADIVVGSRATLHLDLIKLVAVLVNEIQWTAEQEKRLPDIFRTVHQLGNLLLEILRFEHPDVSPLNDNLVELKNKAMEVFMLLPGSLLAAFIQQQHMEIADVKDGSLLAPVLDHLHTMLLAVRIEKTR
ncbi:hypothetical protein PHYPSEUDO_000840 [Phytophthora pseudosyringae]|uniref:Uncharacterized protein n=1 Tax=Phytophthora pseudosyringae TaxID=221518 RepID=A0A8T1VXE9_9STRA|nr:hypothetical protein PHYPSEUDO_000840 [Phytophthora pseudosyringae]